MKSDFEKSIIIGSILSNQQYKIILVFMNFILQFESNQFLISTKKVPHVISKAWESVRK